MATVVGLRASALANGEREFAHQHPINQAASLPIFVQSQGLCDAHALLYYERYLRFGRPSGLLI
jgi:hypothetical protein